MDNNQNLLTNFNNKEKIKTNNSQFTQKRKIETNRRTAFFFGKIPIDSKPTHTSLHFNLSHQILLEMKMKITDISCQHEKVT